MTVTASTEMRVGSSPDDERPVTIESPLPGTIDGYIAAKAAS